MRYPKKRIIFYVDGFNLYYGSLRRTEHRWLDLEALCGQYVKPDAELIAVRYFTAKVEDRPNKPGQRADQLEYLRALRTLPKVQIIFGRFLTRTKEQAEGRHRTPLSLDPGGEGIRREPGKSSSRRRIQGAIRPCDGDLE
jgi:hypothetical protein